MLRNTLIVIGLLVALLPYLGFPQEFDKFILTFLGLLLVFLLSFSRKHKAHKTAEEAVEEPKVLHVERTEVEDSASMHIERTTVEDTKREYDSTGGETVVEEKISVVRRRKRRVDDASVTGVEPN